VPWQLSLTVLLAAYPIPGNREFPGFSEADSSVAVAAPV